jgi:hypothetical protein
METKVQLAQMALVLVQEILDQQVLLEQMDQTALQETRVQLVQMVLVLD